MAEEQTQKPDSQPGSVSPPAAASPPPAPTGDSNIFSLEDLDKIIEAEDPNFKKDLESLRKQKIELSPDHAQLEVKTDDEHLTKDENKEDHEAGTARRFLRKLLTKPLRRLLTQSRMQGIALLNRLQQFFSRTLAFIRHEMPDRVKYYQSLAVQRWAQIKKLWLELQQMSRLQKTALAFIGVAGVATIFFLSKTITGQWLPVYHDGMPRSLAGGAGFVRSYQSKSDLQDLFLAFPEVEYYVLLKKVVVNLRPSESSGPNPMGTFEVYVGVDAQDTAIEVKDRERELMDVLQRALEGFSYDDTTSLIGKSRMKEVIRDRIDGILNQGRVFHIYFNTFIVYSGN